MADQRSAPTVPPQPWFDPKTGNAMEPFRRYILGESGRIANVNSGQSQIIAAQQAAEANSAAQLAAANQAAQAAISASGSTETDYDAASFGFSLGTFVTVITNNLDHAGGGNYTITVVFGPELVVTDAPLTSSGLTCSGEWQIIENPNTHVLASGTFVVSSSPGSEGGGVTFYENGVNSVGLPSATSYGDNEVGPVTIEFQIRRTSSANVVTGLYASMLTEWA